MEISKLKISQLRSTLTKLGLSGSGTKQELINRYNEYMENKEKASDEVTLTVDASAVGTEETTQPDTLISVNESGDISNSVDESM